MRRLERKRCDFKTYRITVQTHHLSCPDVGCRVILRQNCARPDVSLDRLADYTTPVRMQETIVRTFHTKNLKPEEKLQKKLFPKNCFRTRMYNQLI
jgi:hypothetical protein